MKLPDDEALYEDAWRASHPKEARWHDIPEESRDAFRAEHDRADLLAQWMLKREAKRKAIFGITWWQF